VFPEQQSIQEPFKAISLSAGEIKKLAEAKLNGKMFVICIAGGYQVLDIPTLITLF
jgi:hypothetical protein